MREWIGMKSRISAIPPEEKNRVRSTFESGKYSCWLWVYSTGRRAKCPPLSSSRMEQKTLGESKAGRHSQSIVPSVPTSAAVYRFPMIPWSSMGRYPTPARLSAIVVNLQCMYLTDNSVPAAARLDSYSVDLLRIAHPPTSENNKLVSAHGPARDARRIIRRCRPFLRFVRWVYIRLFFSWIIVGQRTEDNRGTDARRSKDHLPRARDVQVCNGGRRADHHRSFPYGEPPDPRRLEARRRARHHPDNPRPLRPFL